MYNSYCYIYRIGVRYELLCKINNFKIELKFIFECGELLTQARVKIDLRMS
jgi:hypothetical protein